jgi:hypothetical protein
MSLVITFSTSTVYIFVVSLIFGTY